MIAIIAYWLEQYVGADRAMTAAWMVTIATIMLLAGLAWLIVNGG